MVTRAPANSASQRPSTTTDAVTGNKAKALEMGITAVAAMIPGGGVIARAGFTAAKAAGIVAAKVGRVVVKVTKSAGRKVDDAIAVGVGWSISRLSGAAERKVGGWLGSDPDPRVVRASKIIYVVDPGSRKISVCGHNEGSDLRK